MQETKIVYINNALNESFIELFKLYFAEFGFSISDQAFIHMDKDIKKFDIQVILLYLKQEPIGFAMFQIDTIDNPWCMNEGQGDLREFFILPIYRKQGYGKMLFEAIKTYFISKQIYHIYLTSDDNGQFWEKLGFVYTGKIIVDNNSKEYVYYIDKESS